MKLLDVREMCEQKILELGAGSFWQLDLGAFVFAGDETTVSVSGKQYVTSDRIINENDILIIDLSLQNKNGGIMQGQLLLRMAQLQKRRMKK